jgi:hypothetical protein
VDHVNGFDLVEHEDRLKESAPLTLSPHQPLVVLDLSREWASSCTDQELNFFGSNAVFSDVLDIPIVPSKVHEFVMQEIDLAVNRAVAWLKTEGQPEQPWALSLVEPGYERRAWQSETIAIPEVDGWSGRDHRGLLHPMRPLAKN